MVGCTDFMTIQIVTLNLFLIGLKLAHRSNLFYECTLAKEKYFILRGGI